MTNEERADKLLDAIRERETGNVMKLSSKEATVLILAYADEIRRDCAHMAIHAYIGRDTDNEPEVCTMMRVAIMGKEAG